MFLPAGSRFLATDHRELPPGDILKSYPAAAPTSSFCTLVTLTPPICAIPQTQVSLWEIFLSNIFLSGLLLDFTKVAIWDVLDKSDHTELAKQYTQGSSNSDGLARCRKRRFEGPRPGSYVSPHSETLTAVEQGLPNPAHPDSPFALGPAFLRGARRPSPVQVYWCVVP